VPPTGGGPAPDTRRPSLQVSLAGRRGLPTTRRLRVRLRSDEAATATVTGALSGVGRLTRARLQLAAGRRATVTLRISRRTAGRLRRALARRRVALRVTAEARDAAGNRRRVTPRVILARRR
jgi:hypothetical protein